MPISIASNFAVTNITPLKHHYLCVCVCVCVVHSTFVGEISKGRLSRSKSIIISNLLHMPNSSMRNLLLSFYILNKAVLEGQFPQIAQHWPLNNLFLTLSIGIYSLVFLCAFISGAESLFKCLLSLPEESVLTLLFHILTVGRKANRELAKKPNCLWTNSGSGNPVTRKERTYIRVKWKIRNERTNQQNRICIPDFPYPSVLFLKNILFGLPKPNGSVIRRPSIWKKRKKKVKNPKLVPSFPLSGPPAKYSNKT